MPIKSPSTRCSNLHLESQKFSSGVARLFKHQLILCLVGSTRNNNPHATRTGRSSMIAIVVTRNLSIVILQVNTWDGTVSSISGA